jgi:hypothetical protein
MATPPEQLHILGKDLLHLGLGFHDRWVAKEVVTG